MLTAAVPAAAQDPAPPPPEEPAAAPEAAAPADPAALADPAAPADPNAPAAGDPGLEVPTEPRSDADYMELVGTEEVVVTSFRSSLGAALDRKQNTTAQVDAIVADDIADFPDLNLAEALQRIPGIAITRTYGEGQQITVRGLGGLYTRVRVNGMETRAAVGNNTGRNFDFSVFASELFNSIIVHKTATADLDEGSLGAVIDLNTARAFNYKEGFTAAAGATGAYNDLSGTIRPRLTGLLAYRDPGNLWGATASIAYSTTRSDSASADTVRWQRSAFRSVNGVACADNPMDPGCAEVTAAQHPRIPRYGEEVNVNNRLGLTAGFQLRPTDSTELRLDALYATYDQSNDRKWLEVLFRGNENTQDITGYTLQPFPERYGLNNNTLISANVNNAWVRSEHNPINVDSRYYQISLALDQRFTDSFYINILGGTTRSKGHSNDRTVDYDIRNYTGFTYDYTNNKYPLLQYAGADVNDATNFFVPELRDRYADTTTGFDTGELNLHYDLMDQLKFAAGVNFKHATLDTVQSNRDGTVCGLMLFDCDADDNGMNELIGPAGEAGLGETTVYPGQVGAGSNTRWVTPSLSGWFERLQYRELAPLVPDQDGTYKVTENNLGYYLQARGEIPIGEGEMRFLYDLGARLVETRQTSKGTASGAPVTIERPVYRDLLPSANAAFWFTNELVLRAAAAKVMSRPALGNLSPAATVDSFNFAVNGQNPLLDPTRATALDASIEWYFKEDSILSLALFYKDIDSFPIRQARTGTFASTQLPRSAIQPTSPADGTPDGEGTCGAPEGCWQISELTNGPGATIKGLEVGFQAPFTSFYKDLPIILNGLGIVANYTLVDSDVAYDFLMNPIKERLLGLSNRSYNATLYYEDSKFGARLSVAHRSDFLTAGPNSANNLWEFTEADTRLDFSSSYNINEYLKLSFEAINLTDAPIATLVDVDAERRVQYFHTGRNFLLGARFTY